MDAITHAALDNLHRSALPRLQNALALIYLIPAAERAASAEVREMLAECSDLITMISQWASLGSEGVDLASETSTDPTMTADVIDRSLAANGPLELDGSGFNGDIPGLDDPVDLGTYGEFAPEPPPTISAHSSVAADISDDEAMALLAAMDAPLNTANHETINDTINDTNEGVSDDEALRLLAEMDAPASPPPATLLKSAPPVTTSAKTSRASAPPASSSADDEALALLAAMGGMDEQPSPASHASEGPTSAQEGPSTEAGGLDTTGIEEIPEWENNDFASDPEMMTDFTQNTGEIMQTLDDNVLRLEQNPTDKETIEEIFRAAHTLKGAAGMFGFKSIERVMHRMENLFDLVRKGKLVPKSDTIDVVFLGLDVLKKLLAAVLAGKPSGIKTAPTVRMLELAAEGKPTGMKRTAGEASPAGRIKALVTASPSAAPVGPAASASQSGDDHAATSGSGTKKKSEAATTIRVDLERLDALVNLVGELVIDRTRFVNIEESLRIQAPQLKLASNMTETLQQFGRHMNEIQEIIMKVRMVPVGSVFNKYPRIVRDLARQLGKQIELVIDGEETEFDKTLVEQIADPLVHLIRNACDHGVEMPAERQAGGKTPNGSVTLSARQEGNQIIIQITDDGKGMDVNRIRSKAIEKGMITEDQLMSDRDLFNLIFEPGFSTAEKVTTVSGRGVGMDVVKKQIAKLKGTVEIQSAPGKGSTITIQLPLTLAIMQSLLVGIREEVYAIPLSNVIESIRIKPSEIQHLGETQVIKLRDSVLPLLYLDEVLDLHKKDQNYWYRHADVEISTQIAKKRKARSVDRLFVVVVGSADRRFGLVVDALLNQQEMVIKPMGPLIRGTPCVAGGAVMGSGEVVLVLDVPEVEMFYRSKTRKIQPAAS